jgi:hypothetical protein
VRECLIVFCAFLILTLSTSTFFMGLSAGLYSQECKATRPLELVPTFYLGCYLMSKFEDENLKSD